MLSCPFAIWSLGEIQDWSKRIQCIDIENEIEKYTDQKEFNTVIVNIFLASVLYLDLDVPIVITS